MTLLAQMAQVIEPAFLLDPMTSYNQCMWLTGGGLQEDC